jgi:hypothetical protein
VTELVANVLNMRVDGSPRDRQLLRYLPIAMTTRDQCGNLPLTAAQWTWPLGRLVRVTERIRDSLCSVHSCTFSPVSIHSIPTQSAASGTDP